MGRTRALACVLCVLVLASEGVRASDVVASSTQFNKSEIVRRTVEAATALQPTMMRAKERVLEVLGASNSSLLQLGSRLRAGGGFTEMCSLEVTELVLTVTSLFVAFDELKDATELEMIAFHHALDRTHPVLNVLRKVISEWTVTAKAQIGVAFVRIAVWVVNFVEVEGGCGLLDTAPHAALVQLSDKLKTTLLVGLGLNGAPADGGSDGGSDGTHASTFSEKQIWIGLVKLWLCVLALVYWWQNTIFHDHLHFVVFGSGHETWMGRMLPLRRLLGNNYERSFARGNVETGVQVLSTHGHSPEADAMRRVAAAMEHDRAVIMDTLVNLEPLFSAGEMLINSFAVVNTATNHAFIV